MSQMLSNKNVGLSYPCQDQAEFSEAMSLRKWSGFEWFRANARRNKRQTEYNNDLEFLF